MNKKGFTLIELLIVIVIIIIIGMIVIPNVIGWNSARDNSNTVIIQQQDEKTESRY